VLHSIHDLEGYTIGAIDGMIGHVKDFYFDDEAWSSVTSWWKRVSGFHIGVS
jgi:hypothetical protein